MQSLETLFLHLDSDFSAIILFLLIRKVLKYLCAYLWISEIIFQNFK